MQSISPEAVERIAEHAHEANRCYCITVGDFSQAAWQDTPENIKASARAGVLAVVAEPGLTPADLHQKWFDFKVADGWVYGDIKDLEAKTHPCMVSYDELPEFQRSKDLIFSNLVKSAIAIEVRNNG